MGSVGTVKEKVKATLQQLFHYCVSKVRTVNGEGISSLFPGSSIRLILLKLKLYIPAVSGVVFSSGADPRQERKKTLQVSRCPSTG